MGSPDFAVPALKQLHGSGHDIALVVTQPDRPAGRGRKLVATAVKQAAGELNLPIAQPASIKSVEFRRRVELLRPEAAVVVAFGQILPAALLSVPRSGCINIHASLLPAYRGPAPIQWAIINEEKETGVTTMRMDAGLDTGDLLLTARTEILPQDTAATLHDRLSALGAGLIVRTLEELARGGIVPVRQNHERATYAPLLEKSDGRIDWHKPAHSLDAFVRGVTPWPGAFTFLEEKRLKIYRAEAVAADAAAAPGTVVRGFPGELRVATGAGVLSIREIQSASGKRLPVKEFLQGNFIAPGTVLD